MRGTFLLALLCFSLAGGAFSKAALAEKRVALIIGNGAYSKAPPLPNPSHDAAAIADKLRAAGFDVFDKIDLGVAAMRRALRDFSEQARDADIAIIFYAGHGMEMNGINYMLPVDATIERDVDVEDEAISLDRVVRTIEGAKRLQLVILDSCRDNPFVRSMRRTIATRSLRSGHADIDEKALPSNTLIAYAQKAGATAEDGEGFNSPYTTGLLKHLLTPGLDVELALRRVRDEVLRSTANRQEPFKYGSLGGAELPLVPVHASPATDPPQQQSERSTPDSWSKIGMAVLQGLGQTAILKRTGNDTWHWTENGAVFSFRTISDGDTELVMFDETRDMYHRLNLRSRQSFWRTGIEGAWKPHYTIVRSNKTEECSAGGQWEQTATGVGTSTWTLTRSGGSYHAQENGMGNAVGTAVMTGNRVRIDWRTGDFSGLYEWVIDPSCTTGEGQLVFYSGATGTHRSVARRVVPSAPKPAP